MELEISPEPTEAERQAIEAALAAEAREAQPAAPSRWRRAGLARWALGDGASAQEPGGDPRVVEP